jgi:hypothetical protein
MERDQASTLPSRSREEPQVHSRFTVKSSCLCYGSIHNIWHGASSATQGFPTPVPERSGTVRIHKLDYNVSALNGTWKTYQLVDIGNQTVRAWFACHSSVDPEEEMDKILRVSGSPYELESGSKVNNAETVAEGVLVINRYDWGYYDKRGMEELGDGDTEVDHFGDCVGLVDLAVAKEQVLRWKDQDMTERTQPEAGAWLHIPQAEYLFGRFGFDEKHTAARSFLFFTESTYFMHTGFRGISRSIRKEESPEEIFTRQLNSGEQFDGLDIVAKRFSSTERPAESECQGPFDTRESLFEASDCDALRAYADEVCGREITKVRTFAEPLKGPIYALLNNLALTCLMRFVEPISSADSIQAIAAAVCANQDGVLGTLLHSCLMETKEKTIPGFDVAATESRIKSFLVQRCKDNALLNDSEFIGRVRQYLTLILTETLELAGSAALDNYQRNIVPIDIRIVIRNDLALLSLFKLCRMFWYGTN